MARRLKRAPVTVKSLRGSVGLDKRTYVNAILAANCPKCGKRCKKDLREDYLSYPETDKPIAAVLHCHDANWNTCCEFEVRVIVRLTVEAAPMPKPRAKKSTTQAF